MATTIDTKLNDDIIVSKGLEAFKNSLAPLGKFSTDYSKEAVNKGASLKVPLIGSLTASDEENAYEKETGTLGAVTVTMDGYAKATVGLTDRQFMESSAASLNIFAGQMGHAVATKVIEGVFAKITKANYPATLAATAGMSMMQLLALARAKFGELKVPLANRVYFPSPAAFIALAEDSTVQVRPRWPTAGRSTSETASFRACWGLTWWNQPSFRPAPPLPTALSSTPPPLPSPRGRWSRPPTRNIWTSAPSRTRTRASPCPTAAITPPARASIT